MQNVANAPLEQRDEHASKIKKMSWKSHGIFFCKLCWNLTCMLEKTGKVALICLINELQRMDSKEAQTDYLCHYLES